MPEQCFVFFCIMPYANATNLTPQIPLEDLYFLNDSITINTIQTDWFQAYFHSCSSFWLTASGSFCFLSKPLQLPCQWNLTQVLIADLCFYTRQMVALAATSENRGIAVCALILFYDGFKLEASSIYTSSSP